MRANHLRAVERLRKAQMDFPHPSGKRLAGLADYQSIGQIEQMPPLRLREAQIQLVDERA